MEESGILARSVWSDRLMVALQSGHRLLQSDRIYWSDLRREVFVVPGGGIGPTLANLLAARLTGPGGRPTILVQNTSPESVLRIVSVGRFISIATEASQGVTWTYLPFRDLPVTNGPTPP